VRGSDLVHPNEAPQPQWPKVPGHFERDEPGLGSGDRVGAQEFIGEHREVIDPDCFESLVERSRFARGFDPRLDEAEVFLEYGVLERDRQR